MAYVNVKDWNVDQVTDWVKGLDSAVSQYTTSFLNNGVTGRQLLNLRADDLEHLGVKILGHQEIILEAVEHLRHFHYELDKENLQTLALKLSCAANSLYRELLTVEDDCRPFKSQTLSDVHNIISSIKPLVFWLDRAPFAGDKDYMDCKIQLLQLAFEMATNAHRDIFSEKPVVTIRRICEKLTKMADHIIQDITDPMILQPASLDLATLKKKEQELGFFILPSNHAIHQIAEIKFGSPAHGSSKIEEGDEIVQVNYLTVVGWQRKNVMFLLQESPPEIVLTLKKRPRHTKVYGQIYMKPYRLPSKKRGQPYSRWNENLPSPVLLPMPDFLPIRITRTLPVNDPVDLEIEISESDSDMESSTDSPVDTGSRMYPLKPRPILQRRNTFTGGSSSSSSLPFFSFEQCREMLKNQAALRHSSSNQINNSNFEEDSKCLRDKSASCSVGLELSPRPTTVIGISSKKPSFKKSKSSNKKHVNFEEKKSEPIAQKSLKPLESNLSEEKSLSLNSLTGVSEASVAFIDEGRELTDRSSMTSGWQREIVEELIDAIKSKPNNTIAPPPPPQEQTELKGETEVKNLSDNHTPLLKDAVLTEVKVNVHDIIKKLDKQSAQNCNNFNQPKPKVLPRTQIKKISESLTKSDKRPAVPPRSITTVITTTKLRGKLDKSHSTPAYDFSEETQHPCEGLEKCIEKCETVILDDEEKNVTIKKEIETVVEAMKLSEVETSKETETTSEITRSYEKTEKIKITEVRTIKKAPSKEILNEEPKSLCHNNLTHLELGLPTGEAKNIPVALIDSPTVQKEKPAKLQLEQREVLPPKPPPRNFGIIDANKPAYPADSPKPQNLIDLTKQAQTQLSTPPRTPSRIFEFPDTKSQNQTPLHYITKENQPDVSSVKNDSRICSEEKLTKHFEPKNISTPIAKSRMDLPDHEPPSYKNSSMLEINKSDKVSPTNSIVRAMIYSKSKPKRKNLAAKRRRVTVNDLSPPDIQGWLYQRLRIKQTQHVSWEKRWFVLLGNSLYGYKSREDSRAACLIFLSGFTAAVASEVKSRSNAFKVYHTGTVFYFSADDPEALQCWIDLITAATLLAADVSKTNDGALFSETDDSDTEKSKNTPEKQSSDSLKKFGSLKKFSSKKSSNATQDGSTSLDRKWFFNKSSGQSKNALPVPTAQFRSYRKIRTGESHSESVTTGNFTSHVPFFVPVMEKQHMKNISVPNLSVDHVPSVVVSDAISKLPMKSKPLNYIHASNPSLCNTHDFSVPPAPIKKSYKPCNDNLAGFVTLEELMIRQTEERKLNPHAILEDMTPINFNLIKPDVVYGEVPIRPKDKKEKEEKDVKVDENKTSQKKHPKVDKLSSTNLYQPKIPLEDSPESSSESGSSCFGKRLGSLKKNQKSNEFDNKTATYPKTTKGLDKKMNSSLPRMHKLQEKYREDDLGAQYFSDRNLASARLGDRSYEMIYCPETVTETVQFAQNRSLGNVDITKKSKIKKQHSFSSSEKKLKPDKSLFSDSSKSNKIFDSSMSKIKLKSAMQYTPMALPLAQDPKSRPKFAFELNLDEKSVKSSGKLKQIFGKQQNEPKKEKTFLGSPKLHRAIFRKTSNAQLDSTWPVASQHMILQESAYSISNISPVASEPALPPPLPEGPHPDYPGLEYPPVFEPETYSLSDPQSSLSILRKQGRGNNSN